MCSFINSFIWQVYSKSLISINHDTLMLLMVSKMVCLLMLNCEVGITNMSQLAWDPDWDNNNNNNNNSSSKNSCLVDPPKQCWLWDIFWICIFYRNLLKSHSTSLSKFYMKGMSSIHLILQNVTPHVLTLLTSTWQLTLFLDTLLPSDFPAPSWPGLLSFFQFDIWSILSYLWTYLPSHILSSLLDIFRDVPKETLTSLFPICCSMKLPQTSWSLLVFTSFSI